MVVVNRDKCRLSSFMLEMKQILLIVGGPRLAGEGTPSPQTHAEVRLPSSGPQQEGDHRIIKADERLM